MQIITIDLIFIRKCSEIKLKNGNLKLILVLLIHNYSN